MTYVNLYSHDAARLDQWRCDFLTNGTTHELRQFQAFTKDELLTVTVVVEGPHEAALITRSVYDGNPDPAWRGWKHNLADDHAFPSLNEAIAYVFGEDIAPRDVSYFNNVRLSYWAEETRRERDRARKADAPKGATEENSDEGDIFS